MEPLPTASAASSSPKDKVSGLLESMLRDAIAKEAGLWQQLISARKEAQECRDMLKTLGLSDVAKPEWKTTIVIPASELHSIVEPEALTGPAEAETSQVDLPNEVNPIEENDTKRINDILRGVTQFILSAIKQPAEYDVSVFDSESAAHAFIKEKPAAATIDFPELRNRVGQALSRLTLNGKILKFQEKGRPSKVKYVSVDWVDNNGQFKPEYSEVTSNLEPTGGSRTEADEPAPVSNAFSSLLIGPTISNQHSNAVGASVSQQPPEEEFDF